MLLLFWNSHITTLHSKIQTVAKKGSSPKVIQSTMSPLITLYQQIQGLQKDITLLRNLT